MMTVVRRSSDRPTLRTPARFALLAGLCLTVWAAGCKEEPTAPVEAVEAEGSASTPQTSAETGAAPGAQAEEDPMGGMSIGERLAAAQRGEVPIVAAEQVDGEPLTPVIRTPTTEVATVPASLTVASTGAEPRVELRSTAAAGLDERYMLAERTARVVMSVGGEPMVREIPEMRVSGRVEVGEPSDGGRSMSFQLYDVQPTPSETIPERVVNLTLAQFEPMIGIRGEIVLDERNQHLGEATLSGGNDVSDGNRLTAAGYTPVMIADLILPEEAVGVGASWTVQSTMVMRRAQTQRTLTYTVLSIDGSRVRLGVEGDFTAEPQDLPRNANQATLESVRLLRYAGEIKGELTIDLEGVMPREGRLSNTYEMRVEVKLGGQAQIAGEQGMTTTEFSSEAR